MSWRITGCIIFSFIYMCNGSPLGDRPRSEEAEPTQFIPAQWAKDSQIAYQWPKAEVPYYFDTKSYDDGVKGRVLAAMASLERNSCVRFKEQFQVPANNSGSWIHFTNPNAVRHCFHDCSYQANGEVKVVLGYDCLKQQDITHAVLHGIGFRDEVAHPQRDLYVKVMWSNIQPAYRAMFRLQPVDSLALVEYDPQSIMQFHDRAFSLNGQATITPLLPGLKIQPSEDLSHLDKMKLRIMYGHECNKRKVHEVLDTCQDILSEVNKDVKSDENKNDDNNAIKEDKGSEEMIVVGDDQSRDNGNKNNSKPLKETIVEGENNKKGGSNEKNLSPSEEMVIVGDENEKGSSNKNDKNPSEEMIVVGDDVEKGIGNENNENSSEIIVVDDDSGKDSGDQNNKNSSEEMIVVGKNDAQGNGNENNKSPSEEMIIVGENNAKDNGYESNKNPSEEMIIVGENNAKGDGNENNKNLSEEMIVVGENNTEGNDDNENNKNPSEDMIVVGDNNAKGSDNENNNNPSEEMIVEGDENANKNNKDVRGGGNFHGGAISPLKSGHEKSNLVNVVKGNYNINSIRSDNRKTIDVKIGDGNTSSGAAKGIANKV